VAVVADHTTLLCASPAPDDPAMVQELALTLAGQVEKCTQGRKRHTTLHCLKLNISELYRWEHLWLWHTVAQAVKDEHASQAEPSAVCAVHTEV
jgi:hypothetical protein